MTRLKSTIEVPGFVNSLKFSEDGSTLVAGVGQEHRLGRWWRNAEAKNSIWVVKLRKKAEVEEKMNGVMLMNGGPTLVNGKDDSESDEDDEEDEEMEEEDDEEKDKDGSGKTEDEEESDEDDSGESGEEGDEEGETQKIIDEKSESVETAEPKSLDVLQNDADAAAAAIEENTECDTTPDAGNLSPVTKEDVGDDAAVSDAEKLNSEPVEDNAEKMDVEESVILVSQKAADAVVEAESAPVEVQTSDDVIHVKAPETVEENEVKQGEDVDEEINVV